MNNWVSWFKLLNKSKKQTPGQLRAFLEAKGLVQKHQATTKAIKLGFARRTADGTERWHLKKYINMMQADKKLKKLQARGVPIKPPYYYRALEVPP